MSAVNGPRVDFYVLPESTTDDPLATACRLCDKAVGAGKKVHVHAPDEAMAAELDRLLWIFKQGSFIGHERLGGTADAALASVLIGGDEPLPSHRDVLLNLGDDVPAFVDRFERVLELVHGDEPARARSRARFKQYRDRGYTPETHKL